MRCLSTALLVQKFMHTVCKFVRSFVAIFKTHSGAAANSGSICRHLWRCTAQWRCHVVGTFGFNCCCACAAFTSDCRPWRLDVKSRSGAAGFNLSKRAYSDIQNARASATVHASCPPLLAHSSRGRLHSTMMDPSLRAAQRTGRHGHACAVCGTRRGHACTDARTPRPAGLSPSSLSLAIDARHAWAVAAAATARACGAGMHASTNLLSWRARGACAAAVLAASNAHCHSLPMPGHARHAFRAGGINNGRPRCALLLHAS